MPLLTSLRLNWFRYLNQELRFSLKRSALTRAENVEGQKYDRSNLNTEKGGEEQEEQEQGEEEQEEGQGDPEEEEQKKEKEVTQNKKKLMKNKKKKKENLKKKTIITCTKASAMIEVLPRYLHQFYIFNQ